MILRKSLFSLLLSVLFFGLQAQETTVYTEANLAYHRGIEFFNQNIYGMAQKEFRQAMELLRPANEPEWIGLKTEAELYHAKCAVRLEQPEAEKLVFDFLRENAPSPVASEAALEIGDYYFAKKEYELALTYFDMLPENSSNRDEIRFKQGYSYFVKKNFGQAKSHLRPLTEDTGSEYYAQANYYYGCSAFFEKKYDEAAKAFQRCESSPNYRQYAPYYLVQIYSAKKEYDKVISYGAPKAADNSMRNRPELNQIVGQAYYEKGDFKNALPYLEYAANNGVSLRPADYYQLGYTQYKLGFYKPAIQNFENLSKQDSLLGQNGLYHLGDSYLKTGNKFNARNAFGQAASLPYDPSVKEDALFNYAKLSYELKNDRDAMDAFMKLSPSSKYYAEATNIMTDILTNTRDYDRALATLESLSNKNERINTAIQKTAYNRGLQLYQNGQKDEARRFFNKSLENPVDKRVAALSSYWLGAIANEKEEYPISKQHMASFLNAAKSMTGLPDESSLMLGQYTQGYNYIKINDYAGALTYFKQCVDGIEKNATKIKSEQIKTAVLGDAVLRAGDCHFKSNQYTEALKYYDNAVSKKYEGFEYALYQKAMIKGLQGSPLDKIVALESLVSKYPNSRFADDALFQLGDTYLSVDKLNEAITPLKKLVADYRDKSPLTNQALLKLGLISYNQGNNNNALNYYKQVFTNNPENHEAKEALTAIEEIYVKDLNRPDEYFAFLETVPGYDVKTADKDSVTYQSAYIQFQNARFSQAIEGFSNYLAKYPNGRNKVAAYFHRAESYNSSAVNKFDLALKDYDQVVQRGPGRYYARAAEAAAYLAYEKTKNNDQALEYARKWEESASGDKSRFDAQALIMRTAYETGNLVVVNEYTGKIIKSDLASNDQRAAAYFYQGKTAYNKDQYSQAYPALEQVTKLTASVMMAEAWHLMATIRYKQRSLTQVEDLVQLANQASAGYDDWIAWNFILLSDVYMDRGERNNASAALEAVLESYKGGNNEVLATARSKYEKLNGMETTPKPSKDTNLELEDDGN